MKYLNLDRYWLAALVIGVCAGVAAALTYEINPKNEATKIYLALLIAVGSAAFGFAGAKIQAVVADKRRIRRRTLFNILKMKELAKLLAKVSEYAELMQEDEEKHASQARIEAAENEFFSYTANAIVSGETPPDFDDMLDDDASVQEAEKVWEAFSFAKTLPVREFHKPPTADFNPSLSKRRMMVDGIMAGSYLEGLIEAIRYFSATVGRQFTKEDEERLKE